MCRPISQNIQPHQNSTEKSEPLATFFDRFSISSLDHFLSPLVQLLQFRSLDMKELNLISALFLFFWQASLGQDTFTLTSNDLGGQATKTQEFNSFGCSGNNQSPHLAWSNPPEGTKSFAVTMYDPDAPTGSGFWHWVVFDIPSNVNELVTNAGNTALNLAPDGAIQSVTNYGIKGFGGPCPPKGHGIHPYIITVYALETETLGLEDTENPAVVGFNLWNQTIAKASIVTYYERTKDE